MDTVENKKIRYTCRKGRFVITKLHVGLLLNEEKAKNNKSGFTENLPKRNNMEIN